MEMNRFTIQYEKGKDDSKSTTDEKQEVSLKELRKSYYKLRNFEISNLWQRSIFLSAILVLLFTGYGGSCVKLIETPTTDAYWFNLLSLAISVVGLCFSCLWIMMAKGSKMWYEIYEERIFKIEQESEIGIDAKWRMESGKGSRPKDAKLTNTNAGAFSVSRINVLIGHVMFVIWFVAITVHLIITFKSQNTFQDDRLNYVVIALVLLSLYLILFKLPRFAQSR